MTARERTPENPNGAGRPRDLTEDLLAAVEKYLRTGVTIETACAATGVKPHTYRTWIRRGRAESERIGDSNRKAKKAEDIYLRFYEATLSSLAQVEARILGGIAEAADGYEADQVVEVYERGEDGELRLLERKVTTKRERDWRAGAWLLERRMAAQYSARARIEHSGQVGVVSINVRPPAGAEGEGDE